MAKDVAIVSNSISLLDGQQIVLNQSELIRPVPFAIKDAALIVRCSMNGTGNISAEAIQCGFYASSGASLMENQNTGAQIDHMWRTFNQSAATYVSGSPDHWRGANNFRGTRIQNGSNQNISFISVNNDDWMTGDDNRIMIGHRLSSDGPSDASTQPAPIVWINNSTPPDLDDDDWLLAREYIFPTNYYGTLTNSNSRNDATYGTLDSCFVYYNDPSNTGNDLVIHDLSLYKIT